MKAYGLTGGIGCGKSTVASLLSKYADVVVYDCDSIAKDIILQPRNRKIIESILGKDIFSDHKKVFEKIAKKIYSNLKLKSIFENFIHPLVWKVVEDKVKIDSLTKICFVESAIIFETKKHTIFKKVINVFAKKTTQVSRLTKSRSMKELDAIRIIDSQMSTLTKSKLANLTIDTDCTFVKLEKQVDELYKKIKKGAF